MEKTLNNKAWFLVLPVLVIVAVSAVIPLMTVVNYSMQETFGENVFFFEGVKWFEQILRSPRFHESLQRSLLFTAIVLAIEVPLGWWNATERSRTSSRGWLMASMRASYRNVLRGSNASRRPSPRRLNASVTSRIARPGQIMRDGTVR